ncbi:MAG TPA: pseudouridine synthase [Bacteroidota bacterium]|nr:pseudouridine synthase [Bacteroidota bacterium]
MPTRTRIGKQQITLARALSKLGVVSRTQAVRLIREGKVKVDGRVVHSPNLWVDPRKERIIVAGISARRKERVYYAFHKPVGVITTRSDELGRRTVYDLLPKTLPWVFPVGRLDRDTSGLLLLTNDTRFGERITNPLSKVPKTYVVVLDRQLAEKDRHVLEAPMTLRDGTQLQPAVVKPVPGAQPTFEITIVEGKNRQIRRMFRELGYGVIGLKRIRIGRIELGSLKEGELRPLSDEELKSLEPAFSRSLLK